MNTYAQRKKMSGSITTDIGHSWTRKKGGEDDVEPISVMERATIYHAFEALAMLVSSSRKSMGSQLPGIVIGDNRPPYVAAALASAEIGRDRGVRAYDGSQ
jgi:hypothetical protein